MSTLASTKLAPGDAAPESREPWQLPGEDVALALETDSRRGLTGAEAERRLAADGPNRLEEGKRTPAWRKFLAKFADPLVYLLLAAVAASLVVWVLEGAEGVPYEAIAIAAIVIANAVLGYTQEARAEHAVAELQRTAAATASVVRDGQSQRIPGCTVARLLERTTEQPTPLQRVAAPWQPPGRRASQGVRVSDLPVSGAAPGTSRVAVVALGGNALLRRGEPLEADRQARAARRAAELIGRATGSHRLVVTHGNGPQIGLLALMADAYTDTEPYPLDVLGSETEGQIGYVLELQLDNAVDHQDTVAVITRVVVDADDPAFGDPTKFIGPVYEEREARDLAERRGWTVKPDGDSWRRVVPSPEPLRIVQLGAIRHLVEAGFLVVCAGGGGVPVVEDADGRHRGVEAVIDKDLASALLAGALGAETLVLATDVDAVYEGFGTPEKRAIAAATPAGLRSRGFPAGSMGPKVEAAARFVEQTGNRAAIGSLDELAGLLEGSAGTQVVASGPELEYADARQHESAGAPA